MGLPVRIEIERPGFAVAMVGKLMVGGASAWFDCNEDWVILSSEVRRKYRRRGIATALYQAIEKSSGRMLKPAAALSDDAFEFWKAFRPAAVAEDLRHRPELVGMRVTKDGRTAKIVEAKGRGATIVFEDNPTGPNSLSWIRGTDLDKHLIGEEQCCNGVDLQMNLMAQEA